MAQLCRLNIAALLQNRLTSRVKCWHYAIKIGTDEGLSASKGSLIQTISHLHTYTNTLSEYNGWFSCTRMGSQLSECDTCNESSSQGHMPLVICHFIVNRIEAMQMRKVTPKCMPFPKGNVKEKIYSLRL